MQDKNNIEDIDLSDNLSQASSKFSQPNTVATGSNSKAINWVIKHSAGIIKTEKQATFFIVGLCVIVIFLSIFFAFPRKAPSGDIRPGTGIKRPGSNIKNTQGI